MTIRTYSHLDIDEHLMLWTQFRVEPQALRMGSVPCKKRPQEFASLPALCRGSQEKVPGRKPGGGPPQTPDPPVP